MEELRVNKTDKIVTISQNNNVIAWFSNEFFTDYKKSITQFHKSKLLMEVLNKSLEELMVIVQSEDFDDVDDDLAFAIVDRINELKLAEMKEKGTFNGFKELSNQTNIDMPKSMIEDYNANN